MEGIELNKIYCGDVLKVLKQWPDEFVDCVVTSPPYWGLRDYGVGGQLGLEKTPEEYTGKMVEIFRECRRVLKKDGTLWLNLGDTYSAARWSSGKGQPMNKNKDIHRAGKETEQRQSSLPDKNLVGVPWRVAFALQADGWYLRQDIIWAKPNPMPESVTDRCTKSHEYIFLLTKSPKYYFDNRAIMEAAAYDGRNDTFMKGSEKYKNGFVPNTSPQTAAVKGHERWPNTLQTGKTGEKHSGYKNPDGSLRVEIKDGVPARNKRSVWTVTTKPYAEAHFATFPQDLIVPMIKTTRPDAVILDPFMGSGTTALVARSLGRNYLGIELNPAYIKLAEKRLAQEILFKSNG